MATPRAHYEGVRPTTVSERARGPLLPLKRYHNALKRDLLRRYAANSNALLDLGCGRGGDLGKWADVGVRFVRALDISHAELQEAKRRASEYPSLECDFVHTDALGLRGRPWTDPEGRTYDAVSSMFSLHYFFSSEDALVSVLKTVRHSLRLGGVFLGCAPDGRRVRGYVREAAARPSSSPWLRIDPMWTARALETQTFGLPYGFSLHDTVTSAPETPPVEYLVDFDALVRLAASEGMRVVESKPFAPTRADVPDKDMAAISALFRTFVFVKMM